MKKGVVKQYRFFGGKKYSFEEASWSKVGAQATANKWRAAGGMARVVKVGNNYAVYVRGSRQHLYD